MKNKIKIDSKQYILLKEMFESTNMDDFILALSICKNVNTKDIETNKYINELANMFIDISKNYNLKAIKNLIVYKSKFDK